MSLPTIPILLGTHRQNANGPGLAAWLISRFSTLPQAAFFRLALANDLVTVPYGPIEDPVISQAITSSDKYASPIVHAWSDLVRAAPAVVILTPQYNWGYPGALKNALDHLYHEWTGKRIVLVTYGGHGGSKCALQLEQVLVGGFEADLRAKVGITLPREFIRNDERVNKDEGGEWPAFLKAVDGEVEEAFAKLLEES
ncbi:hypothetical protein JCM10207_002545 [Rhodosporidiobolus poonsookiae]